VYSAEDATAAVPSKSSVAALSGRMGLRHHQRCDLDLSWRREPPAHSSRVGGVDHAASVWAVARPRLLDVTSRSIVLFSCISSLGR
jgi:hypothetical protein